METTTTMTVTDAAVEAYMNGKEILGPAEYDANPARPEDGLWPCTYDPRYEGDSFPWKVAGVGGTLRYASDEVLIKGPVRRAGEVVGVGRTTRWVSGKALVKNPVSQEG